MPQLQNLVLTDRATPSPVNHAFTPRDIVDNVATVSESSGVVIGENRVSISLRRNGTKAKGRLVLTIPVVQTETINGVSRPTVVRTAVADLSLSFDFASSEQERKDLIGMLASALDPTKVLVNDTFVKLQNVY